MSFYQGKTVIVTGAAGFIGSHLTDALLANGARVLGIDNFLTGRKKNLADAQKSTLFTFVEADVTTDPTTYFPEAFLKPDCVFHFASPASPVGYQEHPVETYLVNSYGTHLLLQYLKKQSRASRFLFASTSEAYGDPLEHPQKETYWGNVNPNGVRSMYDESKRLGESICGVHTRDFGMDVRIIRIFNTYGPRMDPHDGRSLVDFATKALKGETITVFGDGQQTRSYCYVTDLVNGVLSMMESEKTNGETVNLGNPHEQTMMELISAIQKILGTSGQIEHLPERSDDPKRRCPDISKAQQVLGWSPTVSIEEGLTSTLNFLKNELA